MSKQTIEIRYKQVDIVLKAKKENVLCTCDGCIADGNPLMCDAIHRARSIGCGRDSIIWKVKEIK